MSDEYSWLRQVKTEGWENILSAALDVLEPFGALGAQVLWFLQPTLGLLISRDTLSGVARALEEPDELNRLRERLSLDDE